MKVEEFNRIADKLEGIVRICSWCPNAREKTEAAIAAGHTVTHSMCAACSARVNAELDEKEKR